MRIFYGNFTYEINITDIKQSVNITIDRDNVVIKINSREYVSYIYLTNYNHVKKCINARVNIEDDYVFITPCRTINMEVINNEDVKTT